MIFPSINVFRCGISSIFRATVAKPVLMNVRFLYEVYHNPKTRVFFVPLDNFTKQAILYYRINAKVMDLRAIHVPPRYKGQGIAKLLTETAFTYAIVNNYYLYLTCTYTQKYYLAHQNRELEHRILGPKNILSTSVMLDPDKFEELPDPQDPISGKKD